MITATTDTAQLGGTPAMLPTLPRIAPRTRKPLRIINQPVWTERAVAGVVEMFWQEQRAMAADQINAETPIGYGA